MAKQNSIIFRNCGFRQDALTLVSKAESPPFSRIHLRCDLSAPVMEEMGWSIGDGQTGGGLIGQLNGSHAIWLPNDKKLRDREMQIEISEVSDFKFVPVKDKNGDIVSHELFFTVRSNQGDCPALVGAYLAAVGSERAQLKIAYSKQPIQATLAEADPTADEPENSTNQHTADEFANADEPGSPALASQMEMSRRKRGAGVQ